VTVRIKMKNKYLILVGMIILILIPIFITLGLWHVSPHQNTAVLDQRLSECGSLANGSTQIVIETSRLFIYLPKDLYPDVNLQIISHGATANSISNGGPYGSAIRAQGKPNC
jgi:hypothetical protein